VDRLLATGRIAQRTTKVAGKVRKRLYVPEGPAAPQIAERDDEEVELPAYDLSKDLGGLARARQFYEMNHKGEGLHWPTEIFLVKLLTDNRFVETEKAARKLIAKWLSLDLIKRRSDGQLVENMVPCLFGVFYREEGYNL
jgi:hypothetical protein